MLFVAMTAIAGLAASAVSYLALAALVRWRDFGDGHALGVRLLPPLGALFAALGLAVPAFLFYEPAPAGERPSLVAIGCALLGLALLGTGLRRGWQTFRATRRLLADWDRVSTAVALTDSTIPAFRIRHEFPIVAVVGVWRPRLFVAESVLDALTPGELRAVLAHEGAHRHSLDNLKRWLLACAPCFGWSAAAHRLERAWQEAAELEADRHADDPLELASALVKTARLASSRVNLPLPVAAFHGGGTIVHRIDQLVNAPAAGAAPPRLPRALVLAGLVTLVVGLPFVWPWTHTLAEALVHLF